MQAPCPSTTDPLVGASEASTSGSFHRPHTQAMLTSSTPVSVRRVVRGVAYRVCHAGDRGALCDGILRVNPRAYTSTTVTMLASPLKSSGFRVTSGMPCAAATAAMSRSTARAPRALRPWAITAEQISP